MFYSSEEDALIDLLKVRRARATLCLLMVGLGFGVSACGADAADYEPTPPPGPTNNSNNNGQSPSVNNISGQDMGGAQQDMEPFIPEEEEFLVKSLASTSTYVFVPNSSELGDTVARIDGRDYQVTPLRVGLSPKVVAAAEVEGLGAIAYALCSGSSEVAVIRADALNEDGKSRGRVNLLRIPREVNAMAMAPGGRHALLYINPKEPLPPGASVASLQTLALVRLGLDGQPDEVFQLSVTRQIREIEFSADGRLAMIVGQEGVNLIELDQIQGDAFIGPLPFDTSVNSLPVADLEVELSQDGSFIVARTSQLRGLLVRRLDRPGQRFIELPGIPTDIDLIDGQAAPDGLGVRKVLATVRGAKQAVIVDVDEVLDAPADQPPPLETIDLAGVPAGLAQLTPDQAQVLLYSSLDDLPIMGIWDFASAQLRTFALRNQIRSVAISADGESALIIHRPQSPLPGERPPYANPQRAFVLSEGITLFHLPTGYQRPIALTSEPLDIVMTQDADARSVVYLMLRSADAALQGIMRLNMSTARADFYKTSRSPAQLGLVADKVFVVQDADQGRITFMDVNSGQQRTVSGYELNARID